MADRAEADVVERRRYTFETTHAPYGPDNGLQWGIWTDGDLHLIQTAAGVIHPGVWHHVAATFDGANMRIFVDGVAVPTAPQPSSKSL